MNEYKPAQIIYKTEFCHIHNTIKMKLPAKKLNVSVYYSYFIFQNLTKLIKIISHPLRSSILHFL